MTNLGLQPDNLSERERLLRQQELLDQLKTPQDDQIPESVQAAIIQTESSGRPGAIGDIAARAGESRGLMQIQDQTARDLYKKGLLPKVWNGKKVKKNKLPDLLLDPDFNKQAGAALYEDNRKVLRRSAGRRGIELSPEREQDLLIKAHNQGMTKTLKRDLYGEEPLNPKVQKYLEKVKGKQAFQFGGIAEPDLSDNPLDQLRPQGIPGGGFDQESIRQLQQEGLLPSDEREEEGSFFTPTEIDMKSVLDDAGVPISEDDQGLVLHARKTGNLAADQGEPELKNKYDEWMQEYKTNREKYAQNRDKAVMLDFGTRMTQALLQYGNAMARAEAQAATGMEMKSPDLQFQQPGALRSLKAPNLDEYLKKAQMMKKLQELQAKGGDGKPFTLKPGEVRYGPGGEEIAKGATIKAKPGKPTKINTVNEKGEPVTQLINPSDGKLIKEFKTPKKELTDYQKRYLSAFESSIETKKLSAEENRKLRKLKEDQRKKEKQESRELKANENIYRVTKDFEGNAVKKELDKQGISFEQADGLITEIEAGNEVALGALGTKMARAMGEVGVLTNADVVRYIESQSYLRQGRDFYTRKGQGKLYDKTLKDLKSITKKMSVGFKKREKQIFDRYTKRAYENFGKQAKFSKDEVYRRFGMEHKIKKEAPKGKKIAKKPAPYGDTVERNGKQYQWNATKGKYQLVR